MELYTIYDPDSELYVTRGLNPGLEELGVNTRFFETRTEAMRHIEERRYGLDTTLLQNELAFWLLEKVHKKDRWHLEVKLDEFMDAVEQFHHLRVEAVWLEKVT